MNLSVSQKKEIYSRDGRLFLLGSLGEEIEVETSPIKRPKKAAINEESRVYVRTLTPVAQEDISKIERVGTVNFIGDEHVMIYRHFLTTAKIIRSNTREEMHLSFSEKKEIYARDEGLYLMVSGKEIKVETCPFERPVKKSAATINEKDYVYVRTLMPVAPEDISKIEKIGAGKVNFIGDKHVMTYGSFLRSAKVIRSDTQKEMSLLRSEKMKIYFRDGGLFLPLDSGEKIKVETHPFKRADKKRKQEDITKHNEPEDGAADAAPSAKRKKIGEEAPTTTVSRNKNRFFQKKINISDDKNRNTENEDDYNMGEPQDGPR
jgi:hypothetical protein